MNPSIKKILLIITLAFHFLFVQCCRENPEEITEIKKFDPARDPFKDLSAAVEEAKRTDKRILLDVGGEWCIWCHYLDNFFEKNRDVADFMHENFVVLKINYSKENENKEFLSKFPKIPGYPHLFVLDKNGMLLHSQDTSELEKGRGHDRKKIYNFLKKWVQKN